MTVVRCTSPGSHFATLGSPSSWAARSPGSDPPEYQLNQVDGRGVLGWLRKLVLILHMGTVLLYFQPRAKSQRTVVLSYFVLSTVIGLTHE